MPSKSQTLDNVDRLTFNSPSELLIRLQQVIWFDHIKLPGFNLATQMLEQ